MLFWKDFSAIKVDGSRIFPLIFFSVTLVVFDDCFSKLLLFCLRIKGCDITGPFCLHSKQVNFTEYKYIPPGTHYLVADQNRECFV